MKTSNAVTRISIVGGAIAALFIVICSLPPSKQFNHGKVFLSRASAELQVPQNEISCPPATSPLQFLNTTDQSNQQTRQNWCVDSFGNMYHNALFFGTYGNLNHSFYAGGGDFFFSIQGAINACATKAYPACDIWEIDPATFTQSVTFNGAIPNALHCLGSDVNSNPGGTLITYAPTGAGTFFINVSGGNRPFWLDRCNITQSGGQATTGGMQWLGNSGGMVSYSQIFGFTGDGWQLHDSASASAIYNSCLNSRFNANGIGIHAISTNAGKAVNQTVLLNCPTPNNTIVNIKTEGLAASEFTAKGYDISGPTSPLAQLGDNINSCRGGVWDTGTMESTGSPPANQIGFQNNCQGTWIHSEGGLTSSGTPVNVADGTIAGACHWYMQTSGATAHGVGVDTTCPGLQYNTLGAMALCGASLVSLGNGFINSICAQGFGFGVSSTTYFQANGNLNIFSKPLQYPSTTFASIGAVPAAGIAKFCSDCTTAATCAGAGTGHLAVSNGTNWTCQ